MLHRVKLRVLFGRRLDADRGARRRKMRVILLSGFAVYPPFLAITYFLFSETRIFSLVVIGLLSALVSIPVGLYAYTKGFGRPWSEIRRERPEEMMWFSLKIGFLYAFMLYWMILGIVEFLFGYHAFRAALISFVASAVARDGFEIGYLRAQEEKNRRTIFPDGQPIGKLFQVAPGMTFLWVLAAAAIGSGAGFFFGPLLPNPLHQTVAVGLVTGTLATFAYLSALPSPPDSVALIRFFAWPGFTMGTTYFLILAYLLRIVFQIRLSPSADLALLTAAASGWMVLESRFLGYLQEKMRFNGREAAPLAGEPAIMK